MSKQTILITSLNIFAHFGIRRITMSQVANSIHISKRTLYAHFGSKETLINACLEYESENIAAMLDEIEKQTNHPIKRLVNLTLSVNRHRTLYCPAFYKDILHFYQASLKLDAIYSRIRGRFCECFKDGVAEGFFIPDRNCDVIAQMLMEQMMMHGKSKISDSCRSTVLFTFLRGLCTEKGLPALEQLISPHEGLYACN
jgi:AcrR family transcriptional regulator